jgi:ElaB/YqjD/DUF883 family membrane-anchored ribosome-binding protein
MASTSDRIGDLESDAREQLRQLRDQVESLMRERVSPALSDAAARAQNTARQAREMADEQTEALAKQVRDRPIAAVLIAAAAGYLIGRATR